MLPYLENLHFPSASGSPEGEAPPGAGEGGEGGEGATVTEHELRVAREQEQATSQPGQLVRKKSKTTSCIKLKNGCKQQ